MKFEYSPHSAFLSPGMYNITPETVKVSVTKQAHALSFLGRPFSDTLTKLVLEGGRPEFSPLLSWPCAGNVVYAQLKKLELRDVVSSHEIFREALKALQSIEDLFTVRVGLANTRQGTRPHWRPIFEALRDHPNTIALSGGFWPTVYDQHGYDYMRHRCHYIGYGCESNRVCNAQNEPTRDGGSDWKEPERIVVEASLGPFIAAHAEWDDVLKRTFDADVWRSAICTALCIGSLRCTCYGSVLQTPLTACISYIPSLHLSQVPGSMGIPLTM
jgi:hypothetical protein